MRPNGRWWIFILSAALAWGGWWWLEHHGRRSAGLGPDAPDAVAGPAVPDSPEPPGPLPFEPIEGDRPGESGFTPVAASLPGPPPGPPGSSGPVDSGEPPSFFLGRFEGLPAIDEQLVPASREIGKDPEASAAMERGERAREQGRLADAERAFLEASRRPGAGGVEGRKKLAEVYWLEGRFDEVRALAERIRCDHERAGEHVDAREMLEFELAMGLNPLPIDRMQMALERALGLAPEDDRAWLGLGNLARRRGRLAESKSWLDACRRRRPDDSAVWRARLEWAMAADQVDEAAEAVHHLPADVATAARVESIRAWFAAHRGDAEAERHALERAVASDPGDVASLERLAALAARDGRTEDAAGLRRRKAELDRTLHRFRSLFRAGNLRRDAAEMARLWESLGRRSVASGLWRLVAHEHPGDPEALAAIARLDRDEPSTGPDRTPADLLAADLDAKVASTRKAGNSSAPRVVPVFRDDARAAGLTFAFENGATPQGQLPETMSGGVGLLDYDGDGRLDVYLVQGGTFPPAPTPQPFGDRLFRNRGNGAFENVTRSAGLSAFRGGYGHGVAVGDIDNDGHPDLFLTRWRSYALYRNRGDGTFEDATARAGLSGDRDWPTSAAFADLDGDGDLDLYVCHYLAWDAEHPEVCRSPATGRVVACDPSRFAACPDHLFRNDGGRFVDVTKEAGIVDQDGRGLGVIAADCDDDGRVDLFVANDGTANYLFLNRGGMRFEESADAAGVAAAGTGGYRAGMGIARGDLDGDGRLDLAVTNFFGESTTFYQALGDGLFTDRTAAVGLSGPSRYRLGFGIAFLDADDDGRLDLLAVNGHIADERPEIPYAMPAQLLLGMEGGRLVDVGGAAGAPFQVERIGRGLAVGDLDDDGRLDAIVIGHGAPAAYFRNAGPGGHSLTLRLEGTASNRDGVGARVTVEAGGRRRVADRFGGGSYQSSGDPRLHFGLGAATRAETVEVRWPTGRVDRHRNLDADAVYLLREGDPAPRRMSGTTKKAGS